MTVVAYGNVANEPKVMAPGQRHDQNKQVK